MTDVQSARSTQTRKRRFLAGVTAASVVGALVTPALAISPAAAAPTCAAPAPYGARANADLLKIGLLDLHPLGLPLGPVADLRVASTASGLNGTGDVHSQAGARQIDAKVLGLPVVPKSLTEELYQQAPPANAQPATKSTAKGRLGVLALQAGDLTAHATWAEGMACAKSTGEATHAESKLLSAQLLPGLDGQALVHLSKGLTSSTSTGLVTENGLTKATATASVGVSEIRLFAGTPSQITIKVIEPPSLRVATAGTKESATVDYKAPILEISGANIPTQQLSSPGQSIELGVAVSKSTASDAQAASPGLPLLTGTLDQLLTGLGLKQLLGNLSLPKPNGTSGGPLLLPQLPALPGLPALPSVGAEIGTAANDRAVDSSLAVIQLSLGDITKQVDDRAVHAQASSLRLRVLASGNANGYGGSTAQTSSVVDIGLGLLEATAVAPAGASGGPSGEKPGTGTGGGNRNEAVGGGAGGLPITGIDVGLIAGAGALLTAGGGALVFLSRRRRLS
ncbi:MAG TPA: hypothetical protein VIL44_09820 [Micromonospora sp.]